MADTRREGPSPHSPSGVELVAPDEPDVIDRLIEWATRCNDVRALLLESSRATEGAPIDAFSDYDVLVVVPDPDSFVADPKWFEAYGEPLVSIGGKHPRDCIASYYRLVLYADAAKIDYLIWSVDFLREVSAFDRLPDLLDVGYRVLVDKDGLARNLPSPTSTAHIPPRPSEEEFHSLIEEFWWDTTYVAKNLWRNELLPARYSLDVMLRHEHLLRMAEWYVETKHDWSLRPGSYGRHLKQRLEPDLWLELQSTFRGPSVEEAWAALFDILALFRKLARSVAQSLNLTYPQDLDDRVTAYLRGVREP